MSIRAARYPSVILLATLAVGTGSALAQGRDGQGQGQGQGQESVARQSQAAAEPRPQNRHAGNRGLSAAVRRVERRTGGQVLSAERVPYEGRSLNRIKVVDATGRVRIYMDDPRAARRNERADRIDRVERNRPVPRGAERTRGNDN